VSAPSFLALLDNHQVLHRDLTKNLPGSGHSAGLRENIPPSEYQTPSCFRVLSGGGTFSFPQAGTSTKTTHDVTGVPPSEPGGLQGIVTVQAALESLGSTITSFTERSVGEPGRSKVGTAVESCEEELRLAIHASDLAHNFHKTTEQIAQAALGHIDPITLGYAHSVRAIGEGIGLLTLIEPNAWQLPFEIVLVPLQTTLSDAYLGETPASNEP
jgi:hypothetical protein